MSLIDRSEQIYRSEISKEEMASGVPSRRPKDVDYKEAIVDKATQAEFIKRERSLPHFYEK